MSLGYDLPSSLGYNLPSLADLTYAIDAGFWRLQMRRPECPCCVTSVSTRFALLTFLFNCHIILIIY